MDHLHAGRVFVQKNVPRTEGFHCEGSERVTRQVQEALKNIGIPVIAGIWRATSENQNPPLQYVVYSSTTTETAFQDDRPAGYRTYIYLNLWSDIDPTEMANRIRQAMYDADFWMLEESDKGYNQPAYDPATRTYTVQWTWVYWQEASLGGNEHADGTAGL